MAKYVDVCRYFPTAGGTTDWTFSSAVTGYQSPSAAQVINGSLYKYRAESADLIQWEIGEGAYNTATGVLARTTVIINNLQTTAKINFSAIPQVAIVALAEDLPTLSENNQFTGATNTFNSINPINIIGTPTNNDAPAGSIGEIISASVGSSSAISLTTSVAANVTSIGLTAGDWDVSAFVAFIPAVTTSVTQYLSSVSTTSATLDATTPFAYSVNSQPAGVPAGLTEAFPVGPLRASLTGNTTYYIVARGTFTISTMTAYGAIQARRVR